MCGCVRICDLRRHAQEPGLPSPRQCLPLFWSSPVRLAGLGAVLQGHSICCPALIYGAAGGEFGFSRSRKYFTGNYLPKPSSFSVVLAIIIFNYM